MNSEELRPVSHGEETSDLAERKLRVSGELARQCEEVFSLLSDRFAEDGSAPTVAELANGDSLVQYRIARRLSDLKALGRIVLPQKKRMCLVKESLCYTWEPVDAL